MRAIKKPIPIDVVEVTGRVGAYPNAVRLRFSPDGCLQVYNGLHDSWIGVKVGDYLNVSTPNDVYPIDRATFEATYDVIAEA